MKLFDYFVLISIKLQMKYIKKDIKDSVWSTCLVFGLWFGFFLYGLFSVVGTIYPNAYSYYIVNSYVIGIISTFVLAALLVLRYFRFINYDELLLSMDKLKKPIRSLVYFLFWIYIIGVPIFSYKAMRAFWYG